MSTYKYDESYVRTLLDKLPGKPEDNIKAFAEVHGVEVNTLSQGSYRSPDLVSILTEAVNNKGLAKIPENLEAKVGGNVTTAKVVYGIAKDLGSACSYFLEKATIPIRYPIYGLLPGKIQEWLGKKHGEKTEYYTKSSSVLDLLGVIILMGNSLAPFQPTSYVGLMAPMVLLGSGIIRLTAPSVAVGSPLTTIPYYILMSPYYAAKAIKKKFDKKKKELELVAAELPQLPANNILETTESGSQG